MKLFTLVSTVLVSYRKYLTNDIEKLFVASVEMKRKLYGSVLLIGGGLGFLQTANILKTRLEQSLPHTFRSSSDTVEVCSNPRVIHLYIYIYLVAIFDYVGFES